MHNTLTVYSAGSMASWMGRCWARPPSGTGLRKVNVTSPEKPPPRSHTRRYAVYMSWCTMDMLNDPDPVTYHACRNRNCATKKFFCGFMV